MLVPRRDARNLSAAMTQAAAENDAPYVRRSTVARALFGCLSSPQAVSAYVGDALQHLLVMAGRR